MEMTEITTLDDFMRWLESRNPDLEPEKYLFRGLSNEEYAVEASAWRRLPDEHDRSSLEEFLEVNKNLIMEACFQGHHYRYGRKLKDLEILAELQHFRAATCLIDFTYSAQIALWFACQPCQRNCQETNGKVVAVLNHPDKVEEVTEDVLEEDRAFDSFFKTENPNKMWQPQLYRWQPRQLNNRITPQHSIFLFGGAQVIFPDEGCVIVAKNKKEILKSLEQLSHITEGMLFPDFEGFALQHSHDKPYPFPDYRKLGDQAFRDHEYEDAISKYSKAIRLYPKNPELYYMRGRAKSDYGQKEDAIEDYNQTINLNLQHLNAYYYRARVKHSLGQFEKAIKDYDQVSHLNPSLMINYHRRARAKESLEQFEEAIKDYDQAINLNPKLPPLYHYRARVKHSLGQFEEAIKDYDQAINLNPKSQEDYLQRGLAKWHLSEFTWAKQDLQMALLLVQQAGETELITTIEGYISEIDDEIENDIPF